MLAVRFGVVRVIVDRSPPRQVGGNVVGVEVPNIYISFALPFWFVILVHWLAYKLSQPKKVLPAHGSGCQHTSGGSIWAADPSAPFTYQCNRCMLSWELPMSWVCFPLHHGLGYSVLRLDG